MPQLRLPSSCCSSSLPAARAPALLRPSSWAWLQRLRQRMNDLPLAILACTFLLGFVDAFPITAVGQWLKEDVGLDPAAQSTFYATVFLPYALKPIYSFISEALPIRGQRRRPYVLLPALVAAASYLLIGVADLHTPAAAFGLTLMRTASNAFAQLMVSLLLLDAAARDMRNAGAIQSAAEGVGAAASILALLLGLPMYPCNYSGTGDDGSLKPTTVIALSSMFSFLLAACALVLPDEPVHHKADWFRGLCGSWRRSTDGAEDGGGDSDEVAKPAGQPEEGDALADTDETAPLLINKHDSSSSEIATPDTNPRPRRRRTSYSVYDLLLPSVLLLMCWAALKDLMSQRAWLEMLAAVLTVDAVFAFFMIREARRTQSFRDWRQTVSRLRELWPAVVLFAMNAIPSSADQIAYYYYDIFVHDTCAMQWIHLGGSVSRLLSSAFFFAYFNGRQGPRLYNVMVGWGLLSSAATMLFYPMVHGDIPQRPGTVLPYALMATVVTGFISQISFLSGLVMATQACPDHEHAGFVYALYLSFLDMGDSVGGWITAPVAKSLGITATNLKPLGKLVAVEAGSIAASLLTTPLLYVSWKTSTSSRSAQGQS